MSKKKEKIIPEELLDRKERILIHILDKIYDAFSLVIVCGTILGVVYIISDGIFSIIKAYKYYIMIISFLISLVFFSFRANKRNVVKMDKRFERFFSQKEESEIKSTKVKDK